MAAKGTSPLANPSLLPAHTGNFYVDWIGVCKHFGWSPKELCGPVIMAFNAAEAEAHCPGGYASGSKAFQRPQVKGKTFNLSNHKAELQKLGLCGFQADLKAEREAGKPPPGNPKKVNGVNLFPARHFG